MESTINYADDVLIDSLNFKLNNSANYVTDRKTSTFFTSGSNIYQSGAGTRVARINLTSDGWLDPSTVRVVYTLVNTNGDVAKVLRPISGPWSFIRRARLLVRGAICDDIDHYNRVHEMMQILTSNHHRDNSSIDGFGMRWDDTINYGNWGKELNKIPGGTDNNSRTVSFKPMFGLLNQHRYLPLTYAPLTFEFEFINDPTDAILGFMAGATATNPIADNTSTSWQIENVQIVCDIVTLDSAMENNYAQHVLSGKALPITYSSYITQYQSVSGGEFHINISRSATRLKSLFISFDREHTTANVNQLVHRSFNTFVHPMAGGDFMGGTYDRNEEVEWQIQIGSKLIPEFPVKSQSETFHHLKKSLGIHGSAFHSVSITPAQYINDHFIIGVDTEKVLEVGYSGMNTKNGDLLIVRVKGANTRLLPGWATAMYVVLHTEQVLEIRDVGPQVFD